MDAAARLMVIALGPAVVAGTAVWLPRAVRAVLARLRRGAQDGGPGGPPLELVAADLRRLMAEHQAVRRSPGLSVRAVRLVALEGAITDGAIDAARAVGLPVPERAGRAPLRGDQLGELLRRLEGSGVVLPLAGRFGR